MVAVNDKPVLEVDTVEQWAAWLEANADHDGVRLRLRKKASTAPGITYDEALDVALCFGWIDGQIKGLDADHHLQVFTPRRRNSPWSQRNRDHVERLAAAGLMREEGTREVERAKADGRWDAAYRVKDAPVPEDFQSALDEHPAAAAYFATLTGSARFAFLFRLIGLKRQESRDRRIAEYVALLERGETLG